ncbi:hypothetical protein TELCIR_08423 [Teladorsagia circumcincta]|uniref:C3H1-type domain-containing protein n=1 Tax=Teladorsagia circumcincta TaxID=45464 RepID=A0A2G9UHN2_TELCI|nr:hypothetical protein TELCIR_08423 [Teladorsagia circumcincta]
MKRNEQRARDAQRSAAMLRAGHAGGIDKAHAYKTKMCKDISARRLCPRGARCTYAHNVEELRDASRKETGSGCCSQAPKNVPFGSTPQRMMVAVPPPYNNNNNNINGAYHNDSTLATLPPLSAAPNHPPTMVPILPVPVVMPSPTHHMPPPSTAHGSSPLVVLPAGIPRRGMVLSNAAPHPTSPNGIHSASPHHHSLWNTHPPPPGTMFVPHLNNSHTHPHPQFWMHPPPAVYTFDPPSENGFVWSSAQRPELTVPPPPLPSSRAMDQPVDTEQLMMKRNEIINRLAPLTLLDEDDFEDGGVGHVSYTVASSVLDESNYNSTLCYRKLLVYDGLILRDVDLMVVAPLHMCAVPVAFDAGVAGERIGTVIRPVTLAHPQDMVSSSLDKIVDVKERLSEAEGASSTAVNQQLLVELRIAEREMDLLDPRTQASCLLRELRQVDKQIEQIEAARPVENCQP